MKKRFCLVLVMFIFSFGLMNNELSGFQILSTGSKQVEMTIDFQDSIFQRATSSPGYFLVKETDYKIFKSGLEKSINKLDSVLEAKEIEVFSKSDSIKYWKGLAEKKKQEDKNNAEFGLDSQLQLRIPFWATGVLAIFLVGLIYTSLRFFSFYFQEVSVQEQLGVISNDFDTYKRNTIEKERKLMRDLIDSKNRIEELDGELNK